MATSLYSVPQLSDFEYNSNVTGDILNIYILYILRKVFHMLFHIVQGLKAHPHTVQTLGICAAFFRHDWKATRRSSWK
jgi:hypothetical protein